MALVATINSSGVAYREASIGKTKKIVKGTLAFDNLYQTNGMTLLNSQVGLKTVEQLDVLAASGYEFQYIGSTGKIKAYYVPTGTNASAAALGEVAVNTDLSALNAVPFVAEGLEQA